MSTQENPVTVVSSDGVEVVTTRKAAECSLLLKDMFADFGIITSESLPVMNVKGAILHKVVEWCVQHQDEPQPLDPVAVQDEPYQMDNFDRKFLKVDHTMLFEIILAANYLDIPGLMDVSCKAAALLLKKMKRKEIRAMLNIKMDLSDQEVGMLLRNFEWAH
ncbi:E3 ubiquitin ligase complex SCF subunit sconC [Piedraia hortae CBS 480.64]|uniref:E3 ubiquitin ligase complex SCF subunit n=1 Tax=Piedraia hortae CBS 480.64 TaxID=1314780 RepID=A0A6A7C002_9PEZI|nr:E3 ubiquitin ligase complex SCF subunit sconC [Piedraia hortae CBS 480.64]